MPRRKKTAAASFSEYSALALLLPASTFMGYLLGHWLDSLFGTHWIYVAGIILGSVGGFVQLIRQIMKDTGNAP